MLFSRFVTVSFTFAVFIGLTICAFSTTDVQTESSPLWWRCQMFSALTTEQMDMCLADYALVEAIDEGGDLALRDCRQRFANRRWNCSDISEYSGSHFWLDDGTKEAGYVQAIRVAGMTLQVARQCSLGNIDCGCSISTHETPDGILVMEGCPQKVIAAARKVKRFLASEQRLVAEAAHMERHNTFVGIDAVRDVQVKKCHCHGASASCAVKTCWMYLPPAKAVFDQVYERYERAEQARLTDNGLVSVVDDLRITKSSIAFIKSSLSRAEFCQQRLSKSRKCLTATNATKSRESLCEELCCERGWIVEERRISCNCKFKWPADVVCGNCTVRDNRCN